MNGLVLLFIALCGAGIGLAAYFGLAFTPIESGLVALVAGVAGWVLHERNLRLRAEARLEKGIGELSRLLSTDAKAGQVLSQRVNALADLDMGTRMEVIEADMSVLGTVVRQVAEAVSDLESAQAAQAPAPRPEEEDESPPVRLPTVPLSVVREALDSGGLVHHVQPIVTLPQRRIAAFSLVPRLALEEGQMADPPEYMPVRTTEGDMVIRRIERVCAEEAIRIVRRARVNGDPVRLLMGFSRATLSDRRGIDQLVPLLAANRAVNPDICLVFEHDDWDAMDKAETEMLERLIQQGVGLALSGVRSLRLDFGALAARGIRYICADATTFIGAPARLTDFHSADINDYIKRFGIDLVLTGLKSEQQILSLLDDGIRLGEGPAIAPPGPLRKDLREEDDDLRSARGLG